MKLIQEMSQVELAAYVQSHLYQRGIEVILSGGASVAYYCFDRYVSMDIDLVNMYFASMDKLTEGMADLGFSEKGRYFIHPDTAFWVEFPPGPLSVGQEAVQQIDLVPLSTGILRVISSTDCVKDRILAYVYWKDEQALVQAKWVIEKQSIVWSELERWAKAEFDSEQWKDVFRRLAE